MAKLSELYWTNPFSNNIARRAAIGGRRGLSQLAEEDPQLAELVKLRFYAGFSISEAGEIVGLSRSNAYAQWAYARAWLRCKVEAAD